MTPRSLGLPTETSHVAGGPVDLCAPQPLGINYRPSIEPTRVTHSQLTRRPPAGGFAYRPSLNDRRSSVQLFITHLDPREIQCSIPRNFFESRVSRVSLTSLVVLHV